MEVVEIVRIKDVIVEKVSANDEELEHIFGCSKRQAGDMRREMKKLPSQQKHLRNDGQLVTIKGFDEYLQYRGTQALDLNRALIDLQEKYQQANQRIADLENIVAIYEEKEKAR